MEENGGKERRITDEMLRQFRDSLAAQEKAPATIEKYGRELERLRQFLDGGGLTKEQLLEYRNFLEKSCSARTVNNKLAAINAYLKCCGLAECGVRLLKVQRKAFLEESRELTEAEYRRLLMAAREKKNKRLYYLMLTVCSTGIRISELQFITVEAVQAGRAEICMKGKNRTVVLPEELRKKLREYAKMENIQSGVLFRTKSGRPLDRSNIWSDMKKLSAAAGVDPRKVFPHSLRHLFARSYYAIEKDLAHLADILGHSSIETTRIYVAESIRVYERIIQKMRLII